MMSLLGLMQLGIILFASSVVFQLVTLPVEIDASRRAVKYLAQSGSGIDQEGAKKVLTAAALTYVAAALVSIANLAYLMARSGSRR
jgi:Zn-dependent membrane protease YugP